MHLKAITLKGFKSFPDRTRLEFGPGVSVVVGPNGSGKSNVTDAVLWALGEQSPLAVRGQSMQDVIFAGGKGVPGRSAAEVEIVLDNSDASVDLPFSEISISRRLDRSGEGEYRLNGAHCRLIDVLEALSDTGLGKEMHSVVSQGRVESIVTSRPRDRRLLIEEAAGLGKHRKRRRRAQLKLERTQDNLDRALDVEREARSRLRPLKRQAEAAELHARLERQVSEARWELAREAARECATQLAQAEAAATAARAERSRAEQALAEVSDRRQQAEHELAERSERHDRLAAGAFAARSARQRIELRAEQAAATVADVRARREQARAELEALRSQGGPDPAGEALGHRIAALEEELAHLEAEREREIEGRVAALMTDRDQSARRAADLERLVAERTAGRDAADRAAESARQGVRVAQARVEEARREAATIAAELTAVREFLRSHSPSSGEAPALGSELSVAPGYELAIAAALGGRLGAALAADRVSAGRLLDQTASEGGRVLVAQPEGAEPPPAAAATAPGPGARPLGDLVSGAHRAMAVARRLLADAWLVERLDDLSPEFRGVAVTRSGRAWIGGWGELRQVAGGGAERLLAERNRAASLAHAAERAEHAVAEARAEVQRTVEGVEVADAMRETADRALREADRERAAAIEGEQRASWLIEQRRAAPDEGPAAVRRAELRGELEAERRAAQRLGREREVRVARLRALERRLMLDDRLLPAAARLEAALELARQAIADRVERLDAELEADREAGHGVAARLRACAAEEADLQRVLRERGEAVTTAEVRSQQVRDRTAEAQSALEALAERLGLSAEPGAEPLEDEHREALLSRVQRLERRREQLGPVNPLAKQEYSEALEHVEELEGQRRDLETALRELRGVIRDADRRIQEVFEETFAAAARNFEELIGELFPGGRGRLRLVSEDAGPRPILGGQSADTGGGGGGASSPDGAEEAAQAEEAAEAEGMELEAGAGPEELLGVEVEVTPAGKATKRLSLLSGGEKSMTAIAFLFAVFLARTCPFYILDEVEAALDDVNIDRFLGLLRRYCDRAQFIVITHQKRTMEAADWLYGVSMGGDGISRVVSRRLPPAAVPPAAALEEARVAGAGAA